MATPNTTEVKVAQTVQFDESKLGKPGSDPEEQLVPGENDTPPAPSSGAAPTPEVPLEQQPAGMETPEVPLEPNVREPKPVEGETPRELALRLETERLRGLLTAKRASELDTVVPAAPATDQSELLKEFDPEEIGRLQKVLGVMGYVKKDEVQQTTAVQAMETTKKQWLKEHPEYLPENDKGDVLWKALVEEYNLFRQPTSPEQLERLLNKAHEKVFGIRPPTELRKVAAQKEKLKTASHSAAVPSGRRSENYMASRGPARYDKDAAKQVIKGFSDEEWDEILAE